MPHWRCSRRGARRRIHGRNEFRPMASHALNTQSESITTASHSRLDGKSTSRHSGHTAEAAHLRDECAGFRSQMLLLSLMHT